MFDSSSATIACKVVATTRKIRGRNAKVNFIVCFCLFTLAFSVLCIEIGWISLRDRLSMRDGWDENRTAGRACAAVLLPAVLLNAASAACCCLLLLPGGCSALTAAAAAGRRSAEAKVWLSGFARVGGRRAGPARRADGHRVETAGVCRRNGLSEASLAGLAWLHSGWAVWPAAPIMAQPLLHVQLDLHEIIRRYRKQECLLYLTLKVNQQRKRSRLPI